MLAGSIGVRRSGIDEHLQYASCAAGSRARSASCRCRSAPAEGCGGVSQLPSLPLVALIPLLRRITPSASLRLEQRLHLGPSSSSCARVSTLDALAFHASRLRRETIQIKSAHVSSADDEKWICFHRPRAMREHDSGWLRVTFVCVESNVAPTMVTTFVTVSREGSQTTGFWIAMGCWNGGFDCSAAPSGTPDGGGTARRRRSDHAPRVARILQRLRPARYGRRVRDGRQKSCRSLGDRFFAGCAATDHDASRCRHAESVGHRRAVHRTH